MTILATTDGSDRSLRVLPYASALARAAHCDVTLVRVFDKPPHESEQRALESALARAGFAGAARVVVRDGESHAEAIVRCAREIGALAIAIDTRGHGAIRHALFGSTALDIVNASNLPVLVTGPKIGGTPPERISHILLAHDGSPGADDVLEDLAPLLANADVKVTAARVLEGEEATEANMAAAESELRALGERLPKAIGFAVAVRAIPSLGGIEAALIAEAEERGAELIALSTHGHSAARHLVAGSTALAILDQGVLPVLLGRIG